jgi:hypothetical protein
MEFKMLIGQRFPDMWNSLKSTNKDLALTAILHRYLSDVTVLVSSQVLVGRCRMSPVCGPKNVMLGVEMENRGGSAGVGFWGFGSMLAITLSWSVNHSILWMILQGILSWLYVIYYSIKR